MQLLEGYNPLDYDPAQGAGNLPLGRHPVVIKSAEVKPTKDNTGGLVEFTLEVIDGPAKGAIGAYRLNLYNPSEQAVQIARRQLSAICHVVGVFQLGSDGRQLGALFNRPFVVVVTPQADAKYTEISGVFDMNGNPPARAGAGGGQPQVQQASPQPAAQQGQQAPAGAWGAQPQGQPAPTQQQGNGAGAAGGWGGQQQGQQGAQQGAAAGGWQQGQGAAPAGGKPAWGPQ